MNLFESTFRPDEDTNKNYFNISDQVKSVKMNLGIDLQLLLRTSMKKSSTIDAGTCEVISSVFNSKYCKDKLKDVIASKPS